MNITATHTSIKKLIACGAVVGGLSAAVLGVGTGLAQADSTIGTLPTQQTAPQMHNGDQEVVHRGTVIPVHGDDSTPSRERGGK